MITNAKITIAQFIPAAAGIGDSGKNENTKLRTRKARATSLTSPPQLPRDHGRGSNSSLRHRFRRMLPMERMYEKSRAAFDKLMMAFKATSEPKLRAEIRRDIARTMMRELTGISQPGRTYIALAVFHNQYRFGRLTCSTYAEKGRPLSLAKAHTLREEDAMTVIVPIIDRDIRIVVKKIVADIDPVELYST